jgi:FkbM family methyltransferase
MMGLLHRAARRLAMLPLQALGPDGRAQVYERLSSDAVTRAPITGGELAFHAPTPLLRSRAASLLSKEPDTIAWLDGLTERDALWDVGANVGAFSLYAAARARCAVVAFEPSAPNFFVLTRNIQLNRLGDRVTAYCVALSGATGLGALNLDAAEPGTAMSQFGRVGDASRYSTQAQPLWHGMIGFTVDDFIATFGVACPTHLKLDVDGLELAILQGARATLANARLRSAMIEISLTHEGERSASLQLMRECGFTLASQGAAQGIAGEQAANHLFVKAG